MKFSVEFIALPARGKCSDRNQRLVGTRDRLSSTTTRPSGFLDVPRRSTVLDYSGCIYVDGGSDGGGGGGGESERGGEVGRKRNGSRWRESIRFTSPFHRQQNFIGGTLSLCIFMPRMLLPAFRNTRAQCAATCSGKCTENAYFACSRRSRDPRARERAVARGREGGGGGERERSGEALYTTRTSAHTARRGNANRVRVPAV